MNTIWADTRGVHDELTDAAALHGWLRAATDYDSTESPSQAEFNDALLLRNSLRRLAAHSTADGRQNAQSPVTEVHDAVGAVNALLADRPRTELTLHDGQLQAVDKQRASPCRSALAELGHDALELLTGPTAVNLRACNAPHCVLYFVKSHPRREWCSEACGNRARAARHYQRVRRRKAP
ncbi:MAG: ABATE domain-containing protein [Mycobacterium sp.]|nr:ABATE domain-containing protein [Mycobacterium sp.]